MRRATSYPALLAILAAAALFIASACGRESPSAGSEVASPPAGAASEVVVLNSRGYNYDDERATQLDPEAIAALRAQVERSQRP